MPRISTKKQAQKAAEIDLRSVRANLERALAENPDLSVTIRAHELSTADIYVGITDQATRTVGNNPNFAVNLATCRAFHYPKKAS